MTLAEVLHAAAEQFDPSDGIDLLGMLIVIIPSTVSAILAGWVGILTVKGQRRGRERREEDREVLDDMAGKVDVVKREVRNDHGDDQNLRDQIDRMEQALTDLTGVVEEVRGRQIHHGRDIGGIRADVGELRGADRDARADHDDLVRRLNSFIRREHPGADPL